MTRAIIHKMAEALKSEAEEIARELEPVVGNLDPDLLTVIFLKSELVTFKEKYTELLEELVRLGTETEPTVINIAAIATGLLRDAIAGSLASANVKKFDYEKLKQEYKVLAKHIYAVLLYYADMIVEAIRETREGKQGVLNYLR